MTVQVTRLADGPIISPGSHPTVGENIQGPSLIRVPEWVPDPLGRYYLYFADHKGSSIRLAFADELTGPWTVHAPGSLRLEQSHFPTGALPITDDELAFIIGRYRDALPAEQMPVDLRTEITAAHIASPDVHVDLDRRCIVMYFHGLEGLAHQVSRVATSVDGVEFTARPEVICPSTYLRVFRHGGTHYGLAMPGQFYRAAGWLGVVEAGPRRFVPEMRHNAVVVRGDVLHVFWTRSGDAPERILHSAIDIGGAWETWQESEPVEVLRPERPWEGADAPVEASRRGVAHGHLNQLRDPAIFEDGDATYLLYAVAGERGIAIAHLAW